MIAFKILFIVLDSLLIFAGIVIAIASFYGAYESDIFHLENTHSWSVVLLKVIGAFGILIAVTGIAGLVAAIVDSDILKRKLKSRRHLTAFIAKGRNSSQPLDIS